jgi:hypothetical protein
MSTSNSENPSPSMGEGKGGGEMIMNFPWLECFPLAFIPSRQGRGKDLSSSFRRGFVTVLAQNNEAL